MRISAKLTTLAILFYLPQVEARAESLQEWSRRFSVQYITGMATFQKDPLRDKGAIIAMPARLDRVAADNCAIFRGGVLPGPGDASPNAQIVLSKFPTEHFTAGQTLIVAFKISGIHSQYQLPHGEFVAAHICVRPDCQDFLR
jgi:hypothetical protein